MEANRTDHSIAALILAAGNSSRLGQPKQLVQVHGHTLLYRTIHAFDACPGIAEILVVLGANDELIRKRIHAPNTENRIRYIRNPDWERGMGTSISAGIQYLQEHMPDLAGAIISVCDQPFLETAVIQNLIRKYGQNSGKIIASSYSGTDGPPVIFPAGYFDSLSGLSGERGAKNVIREFSQEVISVDFPQGAIDIDTPSDLDRFRS